MTQWQTAWKVFTLPLFIAKLKRVTGSQTKEEAERVIQHPERGMWVCVCVCVSAYSGSLKLDQVCALISFGRFSSDLTSETSGLSGSFQT